MKVRPTSCTVAFIILIAACSSSPSHAASPPSTSSVPTVQTVPPTSPKQVVAYVAGGPGGAPPCATGAGGYNATVEHPDRAPLQTHAEFANGVVRWAICGADPVMSSELLNLRSSDRGKTWTVTDTGFGISPHHAGDKLAIRLKNENTGTAHLVVAVGPTDRVYSTSDGGHTWRLTCDESTESHPSPCP